ncbi:MAG: AEC family transporter [Hyphomicrobiaceae bacterium]
MTFVIMTVAPVFGAILLGLLAGKLRYLPEGAQRPIIEFVFRIAIPALLIRTMAEAPPSTASPFALWGAYFGAIASVWLATTLVSLVLLRRPAGESASLALASCFGNLVLLGLPMALTAFGPEAATPMAIIFLLELPVMWFAAVLHLTLAEGMAVGSLGRAVAKMGMDLLRNPIVIALIVGAVLRETGIPIHPILRRTLELLGQAATPGSLIALGLSLAGFKMTGQLSTVSAVVALKLVALPLIAWQLAFHVFALPPVWAGVLVLFCTMPTGAVAFLFATEHKRAVEQVSAIIAVSVALSVVTISMFLYFLAEQLPGTLAK